MPRLNRVPVVQVLGLLDRLPAAAFGVHQSAHAGRPIALPSCLRCRSGDARRLPASARRSSRNARTPSSNWNSHRPWLSIGTAENRVVFAAVNLGHDPRRGRFALIIKEHIRPVSSPVVQIAAVALDLHQFPIAPSSSSLLRGLERAEHPALMVERELEPRVRRRPGPFPCASPHVVAIGFSQ